VIVGGGSAGLVLANRLSTDPGTRVLVLEAGRPDHRWDPIVRVPAALAFGWGNPRYDWCYESEAEPGLNGRSLHVPRGKLLGGSSSINGMVYQRGNPADYDVWAQRQGLENWDWAHCSPYFRKLENRLVDGEPGGPQLLEQADAEGPLYDAFFEAVRQAGHAVLDDVNGPRQRGFSRTTRTIHRGRRYSAADAYLHPIVASRPTLTIKTRAMVTGVVLEGGRAVGVRYREGDGPTHEVRSAEVILAGGAVNSPQLLQLSGIGDPGHLEGLGIPVQAELPGVGRNLQDHLDVHLQHACSQPVSLGPMRKAHKVPGMAAEWLRHGTGAAATNHFEAGGFACTAMASDGVPDMMMLFAPVAMKWADSERLRGHGYQVHLSVMRSHNRGTVRVTSRDPLRKPALEVGYLTHDEDVQRWVEAFHVARDILAQPAFSRYEGGELLPGPAVQTDAQVAEWVRSWAQTGLHPTGTCRLGLDAEAVTDPATLRVHGVDGLRVVDASIIPDLPNSNTYAPTMMVAEKAADLVLGNTPLAPDAPQELTSA
jgi:choline dehydrogenase